MKIIALDCVTGAVGHCVPILHEMLEGARSAGAATLHIIVSCDATLRSSLLRSTSGLVRPESWSDAEIFNADDGFDAILDALGEADHVVVGWGALPAGGSSAFREFRDACYRRAKWVSLADLAGREGFEINVRRSEDLHKFMLPMPLRELSAAHRGIIVLTPPENVPDHDDPFAEHSFFLIEDVLRVLGFVPSGRILATGLYDPPIDANPVLQEQSFQLGRRLVRGVFTTAD